MPHIVIAEDEDDVREFLLRAFSRCAPHAEVSTCPDGSSALDLIRSRGADLLISDHRMQAMTGVELLLALRSLGCNLPVVIISADISAELPAIEAGASAFIYKPLNIAQIRAIVATWVGPAG